MSAVIRFLLKGAQVATYLGGADAVLTVAEVGLKRAGVIQPETRLLPELSNLVLDALAIPRPAARPALGEARPTMPAEQPAPAPSSPAVTSSLPAVTSSSPAASLHVCPACYANRPIALAGASPAGELHLKLCETHARQNQENVAHMGAFFSGWDQAYTAATNATLAGLGAAELPDDLGARDCGPKPDENDYRNIFGNVDGGSYYTALSKWQSCKAKQKDELIAEQKKADKKAAAAKAKEDADDKKAAEAAKKHEQAAVAAATKAGKKQGAATQKKLAQWGLNAQAKKFQAEIDALKASYQAEKDAAKQAEIQKTIDTLTQQKSDAERLAAELQAQAKDAAHAQEIQALQAQIANATQSKGGMDQLFQSIMMARMMAPAQSAVPATMVVDPTMAAMMDPSAGSAVMAPPGAFPFFADDGGGGMSAWDFAGAENDADPELVQALGLEGAATEGELAALYNVKQFWPAEDFQALMQGWNDPPPAMAGCGGLGGCGLK